MSKPEHTSTLNVALAGIDAAFSLLKNENLNRDQRLKLIAEGQRHLEMARLAMLGIIEAKRAI